MVNDTYDLSSSAEHSLESKRISKSHYHKYLKNDYFYDVWSNIHYGYVGLSVGFSEDVLLVGSDIEQIRMGLNYESDSIDDIIYMEIGFNLYCKYEKHAKDLTTNDMLDSLENEPAINLTQSRQSHWCWSSKKPDHVSWSEN